MFLFFQQQAKQLKKGANEHKLKITFNITLQGVRLYNEKTQVGYMFKLYFRSTPELYLLCCFQQPKFGKLYHTIFIHIVYMFFIWLFYHCRQLNMSIPYIKYHSFLMILKTVMYLVISTVHQGVQLMMPENIISLLLNLISL